MATGRAGSARPAAPSRGRGQWPDSPSHDIAVDCAVLPLPSITQCCRRPRSPSATSRDGVPVDEHRLPPRHRVAAGVPVAIRNPAVAAAFERLLPQCGVSAPGSLTASPPARSAARPTAWRSEPPSRSGVSRPTAWRNATAPSPPPLPQWRRRRCSRRRRSRAPHRFSLPA